MSEQGYEPRSVPPTGSPTAGRWELNTTPAGWPSPPDDTMALIASNLVEERVRQAPDQPPETVSVPLLYAKKMAGTWALVDRGTVEGVPTRRPVELRKRTARVGFRPAELLDRFLLGEPDTYETLRDSAVWEALLRYAERGHLGGRALRQIKTNLRATRSSQQAITNSQ